MTTHEATNWFLSHLCSIANEPDEHTTTLFYDGLTFSHTGRDPGVRLVAVVMAAKQYEAQQ